MQKRLVTAADAFIPGELNLAHAASTYIPADIHHRLGGVFGVPSRFITGLDVHGRLAQRLLLRTGYTEEQLKTEYANRLVRGFEKLLIEPTEFLTTDDARVGEILDFAFPKLLSSRMIYKKPSCSFYCNACSQYLSKSEVSVRVKGSDIAMKVWSDAKMPEQSEMICVICGSQSIELRESSQWFMKLPRDRTLADWHSRQPFRNARRALEGIFENKFTEWEFTREDYYGWRMPTDPAKALYLWCDSFFSKFVGLSEKPSELIDALKETRIDAFFAKNILQYYGLILPTIVRWGIGVDAVNITLSSRGFCDLDASKDLLSLDRALEGNTPDELRFFCAYSTPDDISDFALNKTRFEMTIDDILVRTFGRYLALATSVLFSNVESGKIAVSKTTIPIEERLRQLYDGTFVRKILLDLEQFVKSEIRVLLSQHEVSDQWLDHRLRGFIITYKVLACYTPQLITDFQVLDSDECSVIESVRRPIRYDNSWERLYKRRLSRSN